MTHPDLPGQEIEVPETAVPIHRGSGWRTADETPPERQPAEVPAPEPAARQATTTETAATRRGRADSKE